MRLNVGVKLGVSETHSAGLACSSLLCIIGQVHEVGIPIQCRVRLFDKISGVLIYDKPTDEAGFYRFDGLLNQKYFIVAHHQKNQYNAVIQDNVVPK